MIERLVDKKTFHLSCDTCSFYEEYEVGGNWTEFLSEARLAGWRFRQSVFGKWEHFCPECVDKFKKKMRQSE